MLLKKICATHAYFQGKIYTRHALDIKRVITIGDITIGFVFGVVGVI